MRCIYLQTEKRTKKKIHTATHNINTQPSRPLPHGSLALWPIRLYCADSFINYKPSSRHLRLICLCTHRSQSVEKLVSKIDTEIARLQSCISCLTPCMWTHSAFFSMQFYTHSLVVLVSMQEQNEIYFSFWGQRRHKKKPTSTDKRKNIIHPNVDAIRIYFALCARAHSICSILDSCSTLCDFASRR